MSQLGLGLGLSNVSSLLRFSPLDLDPYLLFDTQSSMIGTLENPTLDLDPANPETLDVITASRVGVATYTDADGLIQSASPNTTRVDYTQGEELTPTKFQNIGQTEFDQWTSENATITANVVDSPFGNQDASKLVATSTSQRQGITIVTSASDSLVASVYAKKGEYDVLQITDARNGSYFVNFDLTNGAVGSFGGVIGEIQNIGNGWFRCISKFTSSLALIRLRLSIAQSSTQARLVNFAGNGTDGLYIYGPQLEEGTTASDFVENTTGSPKFITGATYGPRVPMILVEPSATNSFLYSQPTSALAFGGGGIRTFDAATAPNGETEAFRITNNGTSGNDNYRATSSITFGSNSMVLSVWAKAGSGGNNYFTWSFQNLGGAVVRAGFKLEGDGETQIITNGNGGHTLQIETYPDGWYRCIIIGNTQSSGTTTQFLYTVSGYTEQSSIAGGSVLLWGFQAEAGSVATSYIPTAGGDAAARTRAADDLDIRGSAFTNFFNSGGDGTFYAEFTTRTITEAPVYVLSGHSSTQRYMYSNSGQLNLSGYDGSGGSLYSGPIQETLNRASISYDSSTKTGSLNGSADSTVNGTGDLRDSSRLSIGQSWSSFSQINGHIKRVIYWPYHSDSL